MFYILTYTALYNEKDDTEAFLAALFHEVQSTFYLCSWPNMSPVFILSYNQ